jgi:hypothetical protein
MPQIGKSISSLLRSPELLNSAFWRRGMSDLPPLPRQLAIVRSYDDLRQALRARSGELKITSAELERRAGLADGHAATLLARRGRKRLGRTSWELTLAALGIVLIAVEDSEAVAEIERLICSQASSQASPAPHWRDRNRKRHAWARRMAALRAIKVPAERRSEIARAAAQARWHKKQLGPKLGPPSEREPT